MSSKKSKDKSTHTVNISEFRPEEMPLSCTWIVVGPPGSGKCLAKDTKVMMFDGSIKNVQDIKAGELLMGDDSTPREVLTTTKGSDKMFKITQNSLFYTSLSTEESYIVNEPHILSLMKLDGTLVDISVSDYLKLPNKDEYYGYKRGVDFVGQKIPFDPYLFGTWILLGKTLKIYNGPAVQSLNEEFNRHGIVKKDSGLNEEYMELERFKGVPLPYIEDANFVADHIPIEYLRNSRTVRLQLLAGLIDNYGAIKLDNSFEIVSNAQLKDDVLYLIRSLGFICNYRYTAYGYLFTIYGDVKNIPTRLVNTYAIHNHSSKMHMYSIKVNDAGYDKYYGFELDGNRRFLLGDFTVTHNTTFMENMAYYRKHAYPVARIFMGTEDAYKRFCSIFPPLYVSNYWDEDEEQKHVLRQRTCEMENGRGYPGNYAINIIDDVSDDPKVYKTKLMRGLFKLGSQHWAQLLMIGSQYAIDMPPDIRKAVSYVAIGREPEEIEREKLYKNFGGLAGSYGKFCDLMDQLTGDYTFLIFKKRSQSNELEECVFYYKTKKLGDWKFGCKEYRAHSDERYDKTYVETINF
ncbi:MAG TPA: Hint domain-containing homing endonuclease [Saprospiraceae bacterium]|nr:Hint domain-containing homing endonuclease [Saprospiraceae bacterium]